MVVYKLTDRHGCTQGNTQWGIGVKHTATGPKDLGLCSNSWIHWYSDPVLALFMGPIHGCYTDRKNVFRLWECVAEGAILDDRGIKGGSRSLTTIKELDLSLYPLPTFAQRTAFGILCAKEICKNIDLNQWADRWLSGEDRSAESANKVTEEVAKQTQADLDMRVTLIDWPDTASAFFWAAKMAARAHMPWAAAKAADKAATVSNTIDLPAIAKKAMAGF